MTVYEFKNIAAKKCWFTCLCFYKNLIMPCHIFPEFIGAVEVYSTYITWDWWESKPHNWDPRAATKTISIRQLT